MHRHVAAALAVLALAAPHAQAQDAAEAPAPRRITAAAGLGNTLGWFGGQIEAHLASERLSVVGGLGYTPAENTGEPSGLTAAAAVRGFTRGENHRGFLELSFTQVAITSWTVTADRWDGERNYGPALQLGYHYVADGGFTFLASGGIGWALGLDADVGDSALAPVLGIGLGYTWRR